MSGTSHGTPPGLSLYLRSGALYLRGTATAAQDVTTYEWVAVAPKGSRVLDTLKFDVTIIEGSYPVPRFDRHTEYRIHSIIEEQARGHNFWVSLPGHRGGKEPFRWTLEPSVPYCDPITLGYFYGGTNSNQFNCWSDRVEPGTWDLRYTVTDADGDSDSVLVKVTFTP